MFQRLLFCPVHKKVTIIIKFSICKNQNIFLFGIHCYASFITIFTVMLHSLQYSYFEYTLPKTKRGILDQNSRHC